MTWQDAAKPIDANIGNSDFVRLVVADGGDGTNSDHADWADAKVTCGGRVDCRAVSPARCPRRSRSCSGRRRPSGRSRPACRTSTTTTANVISSAGDAALSVSDPGRLTNGAFSLPEALRVEMAPAAWTGPVSNAAVAITFRQHIGANDALRSGSYTKTLTFTLSTTTP